MESSPFNMSVQVKVTTDAESFARVRHDGIMVDALVDTFQEMFRTRVTAKCKFKTETPCVILTLLDLTYELLPLLWSFQDKTPVPLLAKGELYTLRLIESDNVL
jgi:hypothetical protein